MKLFSRSFFESIMSSFVPCHSFRPSQMKRMCSPIPMTEFMSCVLMIVVVLNSCVMLWMRSSMTSEVFGSRPELGSSQNRYLGFMEIARAIATRFCIPPDISPGYLLWASSRLTRSRQKRARRHRSLYESVENMSKGNITFSSTVIESKRAALWNIIPISRRSRLRSRLVIVMRSRLS